MVKQQPLLSGIQLLQELDETELNDLEKQCSLKRYGPNEQIFDRHSDARDIYLIVEGRVRIANYSLSGREITLDDLPPGAHFGELAAIDGQPRSASAISLSDSLLATLSPARFEDMCKTHPLISMRVMRSLATIVRSATGRIMDLSTLAANNRVHAEILREARLQMVGENRAEITPIPVHNDIASRVSTTRETVARVMNDLAREGVVERQKNTMIVSDVDSLQEMVEEVRGD